MRDRSPLRDEIGALSAYHVPDSHGLIKLDAMENPYALTPEVAGEIASVAAKAALNRYPDPGGTALKAQLRATMGLSDDMALLLGNGSDEVIQMLALALNRPGAVMMGLEPSFVMFRMIATYAGMRYVGVPLAEGFALDRQAVLDAVQAHRPALTFIPFPNNPTGNLFDPDVMRAIIAAAAPGLVIVDEAYHPFAEKTFLPELGSSPNLLVMRTLSKLGLAGLRIGLLAGPPAWIDEIDKVRLPYNVNALSQCVAAHLLARREILDAQAAAIRGERGRLARDLAATPGVHAFPSDANFILFRVRGATRVFEGLKARGVLIKNVSGAHPALADCLRVTVGTPDENTRFLLALRQSIEAQSG